MNCPTRGAGFLNTPEPKLTIVPTFICPVFVSFETYVLLFINSARFPYREPFTVRTLSDGLLVICPPVLPLAIVIYVPVISVTLASMIISPHFTTKAILSL